jgi:hypothetical protein
LAPDPSTVLIDQPQHEMLARADGVIEQRR